MILDYLIVGAAVAGAVAYLAWTFRPRRTRRAMPACSGCARAEAPVRTRWTG